MRRRLQKINKEMEEVNMQETSLAAERRGKPRMSLLKIESLKSTRHGSIDSSIFPLVPRTQTTIGSSVFPTIPTQEPSDRVLRRISVGQPPQSIVPPLVSSPQPILEITEPPWTNPFTQSFGAMMIPSAESASGLAAEEVPNEHLISPMDPQHTIPNDSPTAVDNRLPTAALSMSSPPVANAGCQGIQPSSPASPSVVVTMTSKEFDDYLKWRAASSSSDPSRATMQRPTRRRWSNIFSPRTSSSALDGQTRVPPQPSPSRAELFRLRNISKSAKKIPETVKLKVISATGHNVAVLSKKTFWVFETQPVSLVCVGDFTNGATAFQYALKDSNLQTQHPIPRDPMIPDFSCAALSDSYLAVGCQGRIMAFIIEGNQAGRWIVLDDFEDKEALVENVTFSPNGEELLALLKVKVGQSHHSKVIIYSTQTFPKERLERRYGQKPIKPDSIDVSLKDWHLYRPRGVTFASQGTMIAICTSYIKSRDGLSAGIQLLKKTNHVWDLWGKFHMVKLPYNNDTDWHGGGLTGIALYNHLTSSLIKY